jgi:hypothetical protein
LMPIQIVSALRYNVNYPNVAQTHTLRSTRSMIWCTQS